MGASRSTRQRGLWALFAAQPLSFWILALPFAIGVLGAAAVGLTVGFHDTDDQAVGLVRLGGALLTGVVAGIVGRGLWGWVAASAGATLGVSPFFLSTIPDIPTLVLGAAMFSCFALAPGYGFARALSIARRLPTLEADGRSAALRVPLRRLLRVGVVLSGVGLVVIAESAVALSDGANLELVGALTLIAAICGSYVLYRLVDRLDRGSRAAAMVITLFYGVVGLTVLGLVLAAEGPLAWAVLEVLIPGFVMALASWLLVQLVRDQALPAPEPHTDLLPPGGETPMGRIAHGRHSTIAFSAIVSVTCLALAVAMIVANGGRAPGLVPESKVIPHDAPEVEALLPESVAGRRLAIWSVRGEAALKLWGLTTEEISRTSQQLTSMGVRLDDLVQATAGRSDVEQDPPYFVFAFCIPAPARDLLGGYALASVRFSKDTGDWQMEERVVGGKTVQVGRPDLLIQDEHQRGRPYLYGSEALDTSFIVITDDEAWAEEAIHRLPS